MHTMTSKSKEVRMRGGDDIQGAVFSYVSPEARIPKDHPLRRIRDLADDALRRLSPEFDRLYSKVGRPSIPPERLLRALLLQCFYTIRSERLLMEELDYNLLFRWFVGLNMDDPMWNVTVFSKNRDRLLEGGIARLFLEEVVAQARELALTSDEHFSVDGTLIEAWAGQKSFKKKGRKGPPADGPRNPTVNFHGESRQNDTHQSTTDPQARMYRKSKGKEAKLVYMGHVVMENRHGLVVGCEVTLATGTAEREAAEALLAEIPRSNRATVGGDKGYDTRAFVKAMRTIGVTPHVAQNTTNRASAIDSRTTRHPGYGVSQVIRKAVEHPFGWIKTVGNLRKTRHRGRRLVDWVFALGMAAYNLIRIRNLTLGTA
jgi:transposase